MNDETKKNSPTQPDESPDQPRVETDANPDDSPPVEVNVDNPAAPVVDDPVNSD